MTEIVEVEIPYETIVYETGPRTCDRCGKMNPIWRLNQYPCIDKSPREVCDKCLELDKEDGTWNRIIAQWNEMWMRCPCNNGFIKIGGSMYKSLGLKEG